MLRQRESLGPPGSSEPEVTWSSAVSRGLSSKHSGIEKPFCECCPTVFRAALRYRAREALASDGHLNR